MTACQRITDDSIQLYLHGASKRLLSYIITETTCDPKYQVTISLNLPHPPIMPCSSVSHDAYLRLGQAQPAGQLLPLSSDHVVVLLEGSLQAEQLRGRERRPDPFGFPGERPVKQQVLRTTVLP